MKNEYLSAFCSGYNVLRQLRRSNQPPPPQQKLEKLKKLTKRKNHPVPQKTLKVILTVYLCSLTNEGYLQLDFR
jgi:hypothetical protein